SAFGPGFVSVGIGAGLVELLELLPAASASPAPSIPGDPLARVEPADRDAVVGQPASGYGSQGRHRTDMAESEIAVPVTFLSSHAQLGGSERYLELLLDRLGPDWVHGVVSLEDGPFVGRLRARGHPVLVLPTPARLGILPAAWRLRRLLRR